MPFFKPNATTLAIIAEQKTNLELAVQQFSDQVVQGGFTEGTYENIMEARYDELKEFNRLLEKVRWSIPKRLIKKMSAFTEALQEACLLRAEYVAYALAVSPIDSYQDANNHIPAEILTGFKQAHTDTIKNNHDLLKRLFLQKTLAEQIDEMKLAKSRLAALSSYVLDPLNAEKRNAVLDSITKLERIQSLDRQKSITGAMLRIVGWSTIIFATIIAINPAVGFTIIAISIALTILGELINLLGKKLQKPPVCKEQLFSLHSSMLLFKQNVPHIESKNDANIPPVTDAILKVPVLEKMKTM